MDRLGLDEVRGETGDLRAAYSCAEGAAGLVVCTTGACLRLEHFCQVVHRRRGGNHRGPSGPIECEPDAGVGLENRVRFALDSCQTSSGLRSSATFAPRAIARCRAPSSASIATPRPTQQHRIRITPAEPAPSK